MDLDSLINDEEDAESELLPAEELRCVLPSRSAASAVHSQRQSSSGCSPQSTHQWRPGLDLLSTADPPHLIRLHLAQSSTRMLIWLQEVRNVGLPASIRLCPTYGAVEQQA